MTRQQLGRVLIAAGVIGGAYYLLVFDASVASGDEGRRVMNVGLMAERQNWIIACSAVAIAGLIMLLLGGQQQSTAPATSTAAQTTDVDASIPVGPGLSRRTKLVIAAGVMLLLAVVYWRDIEVLWIVFRLWLAGEPDPWSVWRVLH